MATYTELFDLRTESEFRNKIVVGIAIAAQAVFEEASPTATRLAWADEALQDPLAFSDRVFNYIIADNETASTAQILAAPDKGANSIQAAVDAWRDKLYP